MVFREEAGRSDLLLFIICVAISLPFIRSMVGAAVVGVTHPPNERTDIKPFYQRYICRTMVPAGCGSVDYKRRN